MSVLTSFTAHPERVNASAPAFFGFDVAEALACSSLLGALFSSHSTKKGGPRDDDIFPALSPAWPGQRPANAFAGLTRDFYRTSPGLPFVARQRCAFQRSRLHSHPSPRFDPDIRRWLHAPDV